MIKLTAFLSAKQGLSYDEYVNYYENNHAPLIVRLIPFFAQYCRNHLKSPVTAVHINGDLSRDWKFSTISNMYYAGQAEIEAQSQAIAEIGDLIAEDEAHLFDRSRLVMCAMDERITPECELRPRPAGHSGEPSIKFCALLRRRPGLSDADFRSYYEDRHAKLALKLLRKDGLALFARYSRSYVEHDRIFPIGEPSSTLPGADVVTEMSFWTREDFDAFVALTADEQIAAELTADEERLFDRTAIRSFSVDVGMTPASDIAEAAGRLAESARRGS